MPNTIQYIAFDADDTLWENEAAFQTAYDRCVELVESYTAPGVSVREVMEHIDIANVPCFGYGVKSFTLSMIEAAVRATEGQIPGEVILALVELAKDMIAAPLQLIDGVADVLRALSPTYTLLLITKGELAHQQRKLARSGLASYFDYVEILSEKDVEIYRALLDRYGIDPAHFLMIGNSLRSDVLPLVELGARTVHIPHYMTWGHEVVEPTDEHAEGYVTLENIRLLPDWLDGRP